jgi:hypothetical protein
VIFSRRLYDGRIGSGCGSFLVVNREGWVLTAAHIVSDIATININSPEIAKFEHERDIIINSGLHEKDKRKRLQLLKSNPDWITDQAVSWGGLPWQISNFHGDPIADIAIGKFEGFDPSLIASYPVFKNPAEPMLPGTSLCRLGFPFHQINATFDPVTRKFALAPNVLPIPRFPNDGIHTRVPVVISPDGQRQVKFVETSSPGLKGQSGGPIFDQSGFVWALQSKTQSMALGFAPEIKEGNRKIVEHQFMHVGWGSHVEEIIKLFQKHGVGFSMSGAPSIPTT